MRRGANLQGLTRASCRLKVQTHTRIGHRRSAAEEALSILCRGLATGSAPGHAHAALNRAQRSLRSEWFRPGRRDDDVVLGSSLSESDEPPS